tara:strand:- start:468 stop:1163 length:696 start_codon:yes stop_codon:yes gene_type:complete
MKAIGIVVMVIILFFLGYMMYDTEDEKITITGIDVKKLKTITETIECYSESQDFTCGQISFQTNSDLIIEETETITVIKEQEISVTDDQGNISIETQNVTTTQVVPKISNADITYLDKQTGDFMVCKLGNQCVIEADIKLYDKQERIVPAPYSYQLSISCEHRNGCNQEQTRTTSAGQVTDGSGGVRYSWTTSFKDSLGDYEIMLNVRSAILDSDGSPIILPKKISLVLIS